LSFPEVVHCLICEDIRPEPHKKLSVLGFYGVSPDVTIRVQHFNKPIDRLAFLFIVGPCEAIKVTLVAELRRSGGSPIKLVDGVSMNIPKNPTRAHLTFAFTNVTFESPDDYAFVLNIDGKDFYSAAFRVEQGGPSEFKE